MEAPPDLFDRTVLGRFLREEVNLQPFDPFRPIAFDEAAAMEGRVIAGDVVPTEVAQSIAKIVEMSEERVAFAADSPSGPVRRCDESATRNFSLLPGINTSARRSRGIGSHRTSDSNGGRRRLGRLPFLPELSLPKRT